MTVCEEKLMSNDQTRNVKSFGKRLGINRSSVLVISALILILLVAFTVRILPMRWEIPGQIHLNEYDPYYQYSITDYMVKNGLFSPYTDHWINYQQWYPNGLDMSQSLPALPMTGAVLYQAVSFLGVNVDLMTFCAMLAVVLGTLCCLLIYFIGKDLGGHAVGLFAALFLALAPSFLQRSSLGFFDTEIPGILGLLLFILMFLRSMNTKQSLYKSLIYSVGAALALAYFIAGWGAAYYILDLAALFVFILVVLKRYDRRLLINYGVTMGLGLLIAAQVPYIGFSYLTSVPILPVAGVFVVLLVAEFLQHYTVSAKNKMYIVIGMVAAVVVALVPLAYSGYLSSTAGKFVNVLLPTLRGNNALIASVAEHRVPAWGNIYVELGIAILFFITGLYFTLKNPTNRNIFLILFGATGLYFGVSMARLLAIFAPAFALLAAIGIISMLKPFMSMLKETPNATTKAKRKLLRVSKEYSIIGIVLIFVILMPQFVFNPIQKGGIETGGIPRQYASGYMPTSISAAGLPVVPPNQMPQWLNMLDYTSTHLHTTDVVIAWWDYGYWLSVMGNVTTLADNATVDAEQIENLAAMYMSTEEDALNLISTTYGQKNVQYILVFAAEFVFPTEDGYYAYPYGLGDEGKWMQMARISGSANERLTKAGFMHSGNTWTNETAFGSSDQESGGWQWSEQGINTVVYKLLSNAEYDFVSKTNGIVNATSMPVELQYFKLVHNSGAETNFGRSGDLVPLVALYKIDWAAYNAAHQKR